MRKTLISILGISIFLNILLTSFVLANTNAPQRLPPQTINSKYTYLSPRVFIENQNDILINFVDLRNQLKKYTDTIQNPFGMYFEYLPSGVSIGINEKTSYVLASLLKVPLSMAVYNEIESGKLHLSDTVSIKKEWLDPYFGDLWKKGAGTEISIEDAMNWALSQSDNTAKNVLFNSIDAGGLEDVFSSLDIPLTIDANQPVVSPKNYSSILRSLYLASYLNIQDSNEILRILTTSPFNDKLVAGIPPGVKVAHKIGVHQVPGDTASVYTDCGIVYIPKRPYILCLMGKMDEQEARIDMAAVSKMVYAYVKNAQN
ncbi:MAG: serine hydrolase [Candidatus Levyibacteriota bacterium]